MKALSIIRQELLGFRVFNTNARKLITANLLFGLFNPFYVIFSSTFIFSSTHGELDLNLIYNICVFTGVILGFVGNGYLLRYFQVKTMLIGGAGLLFTAIAIMFLLPEGSLNGYVVFIFGIFMGFGNGIYWSSRNYLTVVNTRNENRDFFAGLDFILISVGRILTPLFIGVYIGESIQNGWFTINQAYQSTLIIAFALVLWIALIIIPRKYKTVRANKFLYLKYLPLWNKIRKMIFILGLFQGAMLALPPVLILKYVGNETSVGIISSISYAIAIVFVYFVSKRSGMQHRTKILKSGAYFLLAGSLFFSVFLFSMPMISTAILMGVFFICDPVLNFPFRATFMKAMDEINI